MSSRSLLPAVQLYSALEWMEFFKACSAKESFPNPAGFAAIAAKSTFWPGSPGAASTIPSRACAAFCKAAGPPTIPTSAPRNCRSLLRAIRDDPHSPEVRIGLRLLCLLAVRPSELREAHWSEFDLERRLWTIPAERMKKRREHLVPLSRQALAALRALREITGQHVLLFPGRVDDSKPRSIPCS